MRESVPLPMESRYATLSLMPCTSRNCSVSAPGTTPACQCLPPSVLTTKVPPVPLAHTTFEFTGLIPISVAAVPLFCGVKVGAVCESESVARNRTTLARMKLRGEFIVFLQLQIESAYIRKKSVLLSAHSRDEPPEESAHAPTDKLLSCISTTPSLPSPRPLDAGASAWSASRVLKQSRSPRPCYGCGIRLRRVAPSSAS